MTRQTSRLPDFQRLIYSPIIGTTTKWWWGGFAWNIIYWPSSHSWAVFLHPDFHLLLILFWEAYFWQSYFGKPSFGDPILGRIFAKEVWHQLPEPTPSGNTSLWRKVKIFLLKLNSLSLLTISTFNHFTLKEGAINLLKLHSSISPPLSKTFLWEKVKILVSNLDSSVSPQGI